MRIVTVIHWCLWVCYSIAASVNEGYLSVRYSMKMTHIKGIELITTWKLTRSKSFLLSKRIKRNILKCTILSFKFVWDKLNQVFQRFSQMNYVLQKIITRLKFVCQSASLMVYLHSLLFWCPFTGHDWLTKIFVFLEDKLTQRRTKCHFVFVSSVF